MNMFNGCDECTVTNWAITSAILRSINPSCITSDTVLQIVCSLAFSLEKSVLSKGKVVMIVNRLSL